MKALNNKRNIKKDIRREGNIKQKDIIKAIGEERGKIRFYKRQQGEGERENQRNQ